MYCKYCGSRIDDGSKFCPNCGAKLIDVVVPPEYERKEDLREDINTEQDPGPYKVFAIIGYIGGIFSLFTCFIPFIFPGSIVFLVLSCLGSKSTNEDRKNKAATGRFLSIIALMLNIVLTVAVLIWYINFIIRQVTQ